MSDEANLEGTERYLKAELTRQQIEGLAHEKQHSNITGKVDLAAIERYLTAEMTRLQIPGLALGIVHGDRIIAAHGFGIADSSGRAVTAQTPFYIGSLTKSFTALAIMQLVEAGRIELDAPVRTYLPWFQLADQQASARITVRHLLNQTSGLSEKVGNNIWASSAALEEEIRTYANAPLAHPVGARFEYSNVNYNIAGLVLEKVSGQSYADYVSQHILQPLDMEHATASRSEALDDGLAEGHYYRFGHPYPGVGPLPPANLPSGLLIACVEDMTHYLIAHLNDGRYRSASVLSVQGIKTLHTPVAPMPVKDFHYAMGWAVVPIDGRLTIRHSGDTGYFHSAMMLQPDTGWGLVLLANASGFVQIRQLDEITRNVIRMLNGVQSPAPVSQPTMMRTLYWTMLLMPLLLIAGIGFGLQQWLHGGGAPLWQVIMTVMIYSSIASFFLFRLPGLIPFSLTSMRVFYPEVAYALLASGALGYGWSIIYLAYNVLQQII